MKLIGIAGLAQTGKSTVAEYLQLKYKFAHLSLAAPIKNMISTLFFSHPCNEGIMWINDNKAHTPPALLELAPGTKLTIRDLLQTLGTEWGRTLIHPDIWINSLMRDLALFEEEEWPGVVIADIRFENEARVIREHGGTILHITRPGIEKTPHASEQGIEYDYNDWCIHNTGSFANLYANVSYMMESYYV